MKPNTSSTPAAKKKVLVVDDDAQVMEVITTLLKDADYDVIEANYSLPALFSAARSVPDLMLVDIRMPIMNGLELIEQFKNFQETRHVPIVAITGMDTPEMRKAAAKLGCIGFLPKPFDVKEFPSQIAAFIKAAPAAPAARK